jgi:hypothetical protein
MEDPAEDPDPLVAAEQAFEKDDLAGQAKGHAGPGGGRGGRRNLERRRRAGVLDDLVDQAGHEHEGREIE